MNIKKTLLKSSVAILIFTLFISNGVFAQFQINNSSNFKLTYKSQTESAIESMAYDFVGNYIVQQWKGAGLNKFFKEPIIQILDIRDQSVYEYKPESQKIHDTTPPVRFSSDPHSIMNQKDSAVNGETYQYFLTKKENDFGSTPLISHVFFLKELELPNKYRIISEIYGGKSNIFPLYHSGVIFSKLTKEGSKTITHFELESISESDYSEEEIKEILSLLGE
ncbi:hypothetical protein [Marivirga sp.]|uniref:hypothetical protein n=1 Tax=Marivirga sp. TaxID=2018662 RepID=UPI003DA74252